MTIESFAQQVNAWGAERTPFLFIVDFELKKPLAFRLDEVDPEQILYACNQFGNGNDQLKSTTSITLHKHPIPVADYTSRFDKVYNHLQYGDSFLTNLTVRTPIELNCSLKDLFYLSEARYKLWFKGEFLVFSPETFVQIVNSKIFSFPMKGTIDAQIPNATSIILLDKKEEAEHITIVDLIRNDLSQVATQVSVSRFRYIEELKTNLKNLLQVSSEVCGQLADDFHSQLGDILIALLPAGSVSGAPKPKTLEVIREAEGEDRGYYTGVFGYYDGEKLDSAVMIRYIEKSGDQLFYRSGGGITTQSNAEQEYKEAIDKIYVPVN
ncbi:MAG: aminodeoxychorismate synthase component I [Cyclobacteriaceae bacterium]|nr:aminodeoxychorismate synthase component I [Cyclobacteriaceae bacterium]